MTGNGTCQNQYAFLTLELTEVYWFPTFMALPHDGGHS